MSIDLTSLWDFAQPALSEQRFRAALSAATGDEALILQTQIARTYGLRRDFAGAQEILNALEPHLLTAGAEARARYALEFGRTFASAAHPSDSRTIEATEEARDAYRQACEIARDAHLDGLAVDALHMMSFVETAPADQLRWGQQALAVVEASPQAAAKAWEAPLLNNIGYALHQLGRYDEALSVFERAVLLRECGPNAEATRVAHWMVAWTLRALGRLDEALPMQLRLEHEGSIAGAPDPFVLEELENLYRLQGNEARAAHYAQLREAASEEAL